MDAESAIRAWSEGRAAGAAPSLTVNVADAVVIRPGDRVLVHMPDSLSAEAARLMAEQWKREMPDVQLVLLAGGTVVGVERAV